MKAKCMGEFILKRALEDTLYDARKAEANLELATYEMQRFTAIVETLRKEIEEIKDAIDIFKGGTA